MNDSERMKVLIKSLGLNTHSFAISLGYSHSTGIRHVINGRNNISNNLADLIVTKYPEINKHWLLTGKEGVFKEKTTSGIINMDEDFKTTKSDVTKALDISVIKFSTTDDIVKYIVLNFEHLYKHEHFKLLIDNIKLEAISQHLTKLMKEKIS